MPFSPDSPPARAGLLGLRICCLVALVVASTALFGPGVSAVDAPAPAWGAASLSGRWTWPVPAPHEVVRGYDAPAEKWSPGHRGIDIAAVDGTVVTAPEAGVVHFSGAVVDRPVLSIEHADGVLSSFEPVVGTVARGTAVARGQPVGVLQSGHCGATGCLHLGARVRGRYVNPLLLLGVLRPAVLLPTRPMGGAGPTVRDPGDGDSLGTIGAGRPGVGGHALGWAER